MTSTSHTTLPFDARRANVPEAQASTPPTEKSFLRQIDPASVQFELSSLGLRGYDFEDSPQLAEKALPLPKASDATLFDQPPDLKDPEAAEDIYREAERGTSRNGPNHPPPDSGYASSNTHTHPSAHESLWHLVDIKEEPGTLAMEQLEVDDAVTVYSIIDTSSETELDAYKSELSDAILASIRPLNCQPGQIDLIATALPSLLRSLALRLGLPGSSKVDKEVMYFVHKYRRDIADRLLTAAKDLHDDEVAAQSPSEPCLKPDIGDWLQDVTIGTLESSNEPDVEPRARNAGIAPPFEPFEECQKLPSSVPEEGEELPPLPEESGPLPDNRGYQDAIFNSAAYQWLLASLEKTVKLSVEGEDFCAMVQSTVSSCLERHRSVSSTRASECYTMVFQADWNPTAFLHEQFPDSDADIGRLLGEVLTLTGTTTNAQLVPCAEYLSQTWPSTGLVLFRLLQQALLTGATVEGPLDDGTNLKILFRTSSIEIEVGGTAASIAEIGEQIAWVAGALRPSCVTSGIATCTPHINMDDTKKPTTCNISFIQDCRATMNKSANGQCWHELCQNPVLVEGFPIPTRSPRALGLEVPLNVLSGLTKCPRVNRFLGRYYLKGYSTAIMAKEKLGTEMLWHVYYSPDGSRLPYPTPESETEDKGLRIELNDIRRARHIVGWCSEAEFFAGASSMEYDIKPTKLKPPSRDFALEKISLSVGGVVTAGCQFAIGTKDSHVRITRTSYYTKLNWLGKKYFNLWDVEDKRSWLINGTATLLHLLRTSLRSYKTGSLQSVFLLDENQLAESSNPLTLGSSIDFLLNLSNLKLGIFPQGEETVRDHGGEGSTTRIVKVQRTLRDRVEELYEIMEMLIDHNASREEAYKGFNAKLRVQGQLDGWDFADVATDMDPFILKRTTVPAQMKSWVDFTRSIPAITLFGRGFGDIIRASPASTESSSNPAIRSCIEWQTVPKNRHLLCVSVADLCKILARTGDDSTSPITLGDGIIWHNPHEGNLFQKACLCSSGQTATRVHHPVQEVRSSLQRFTMSKSTVDLALHPHGAVIFGEKQSWFLGRNASSSDNASQSTTLGHSSTSAQSDSGDASPSVPTETSTSASGQHSDEGLTELAAMTVSPEGSSAKARGKRKASPDGGKPGTKRRLLTRVADQLEKTFHGVGSRGKETG